MQASRTVKGYGASTDPKRRDSIIAKKSPKEMPQASPGGLSLDSRDLFLGGNLMQQRAQLLGAFDAEDGFELRLRVLPIVAGRAKAPGAGAGQLHLFAAAVGLS